MRRPLLLLWLAVCLAAVAGCAVAPRDETPERTPEGDLANVPDRRLEAGDVPPAVAGLVREAESASMAGEHEQAAVSLERAIRIAPRNAALWQNLAVVRYRQGRYAQAESLALKSNSLTADAELKRRNWVLIAEARRSRGAVDGARQAEAEAQRLRDAGDR